MAAGSRDRPPMLATGQYTQWQSCFLRYIDTRPNGDALRKCILEGPYTPSTVVIPVVPTTDDSPEVPERTTVEKILNIIGDEICSTVDSCKIAHDMWIAIERLQQGESLNIQHVKTNLFWEFGKFTSHDGESMESYYSRFYKMMNEMIRNNLTVATMQEVNEIRAERIATNANPLALVAATQQYLDPYYQAPKSHQSYAPPSKQSSSTRFNASTKYKGKEITKLITPSSESASEEDSDPEQAQRDKDMHKNLALIAKYFKKIDMCENTYPFYVRIMQKSKENSQNWTITDTGTEEHTKSRENAIKNCSTHPNPLLDIQDAHSTDSKSKRWCAILLKNIWVPFGLVMINLLQLLVMEILVQGNITINRVYYVEGLNHNLLLSCVNFVMRIWRLLSRNLRVSLEIFRETIYSPVTVDLISIQFPFKKQLHQLQSVSWLKPHQPQAWLWHRRLSHLNFDYINLLSKKDVVIGLPKMKYVKDQLCSSCKVSKAKRSSFKTKVVPSSKGRLNLLHMDLCGPMRVASINGKKYILVIVDDYPIAGLYF
ncbi:retrovirus-related pol polyprotein from transposon TNT 1-94 [Tanacetum coccineum]